jgi:hypothetical protein
MANCLWALDNALAQGSLRKLKYCIANAILLLDSESIAASAKEHGAKPNYAASR